LVLLGLYWLREAGAGALWVDIAVLLFCLVVALAAVAIALAFYSETRLLDRAHRHERSPVRMFGRKWVDPRMRGRFILPGWTSSEVAVFVQVDT
jgi:hypothetical protein